MKRRKRASPSSLSPAPAMGQEALVGGSGKLISRANRECRAQCLRFPGRGETVTIEMQTDRVNPLSIRTRAGR